MRGAGRSRDRRGSSRRRATLATLRNKGASLATIWRSAWPYSRCRRIDVTAQVVGQQLHAVADAQNRPTGVKHKRGQDRCARLVKHRPGHRTGCSLSGSALQSAQRARSMGSARNTRGAPAHAGRSIGRSVIHSPGWQWYRVGGGRGEVKCANAFLLSVFQDDLPVFPCWSQRPGTRWARSNLPVLHASPFEALLNHRANADQRCPGPAGPTPPEPGWSRRAPGSRRSPGHDLEAPGIRGRSSARS